MPRTVPKKDRFFGLFEKLRQPDITGELDDVHSGEFPKGIGCVSWTKNGERDTCALRGPWCYGDYDIRASRSSSVYGNSSTVQPKALRLFAVIKF